MKQLIVAFAKFYNLKIRPRRRLIKNILRYKFELNI